MKPFTGNRYPFLAGGGQMGELTRGFDWSQTPVGSPDQWPQSLRTTVSTILSSRFPMFLWWGPQLIQFYNDAYRPSFGDEGKHPTALGQPGAECWPEIWPTIKPLIDQVLAGGESVWLEDQLIPIVRNGQLEQVYWTFSYSPVQDDAGQIVGVLVVCQETTRQVVDRQQQEDRFRSIVEQAPVATCLFVGPELRIEVANQLMIDYFGQGPSIVGQPVRAVLRRSDADLGAIALLEQVLTTGKAFTATAAPAELTINGLAGTYYFDINLKPLHDASGTVYAILETAVDVTEQVRAHKVIEESEARFKTMAEGTDILITVGDEWAKAIYFNQAWTILTGRPVQQLLDVGWVDLVHPDDRDGYVDMYQSAFRKREPFTGEFRILNHAGEYRWLLTRGPVRYHSDGSFAGYISSCVDITDRKQAEEALRATEAKLRSVINNAPAGIGLFMGRDLVIELPNQTLIDIIGKGPHIEGRPLREVMPELVTENQPFLQILDEVYTTGQPFQSYGSLVHIVRQGVMTQTYYNITYTPLFDQDGRVYAILDIAVDVTGEVLARQKAEEAQASLHGAIELAQLGTWELDVANNTVTYSDRIKMWFGLTENSADQGVFYDPVHKKDRHRIQAAIRRALEPDSGGVYDEEYELVDQQTGRHRVVHAQGITFFDEQGSPVKISGTAQDVTEQRRVRQELERLVGERTGQLQALIQDLERSNENLQQFAYIASHDLQEPLRKIQQFGDLLNKQHGETLGDGLSYLARMQSAARRMSVLIKDLLTYSRISTGQEASKPVALTQVLDAVLTDLEVRIRESGATINQDTLPTVRGDASQLGQLFQNLLGNALKFQPAGTQPVIDVRCQTVEAPDLPAGLRPSRPASAYYRIDVTDNGIGFDEKYLDRIFQVFQRLHGKQHYAGTGIGLAICEKVVANHGGALTARSQVGQGSTFSVYLPIE